MADGCDEEVWRESAEVLREREERSGIVFTGRAFGDGGMARPSRGVRAPVLREPGIGGRSSGAGLDMNGVICCGCCGLVGGFYNCQRAVSEKG